MDCAEAAGVAIESIAAVAITVCEVPSHLFPSVLCPPLGVRFLQGQRARRHGSLGTLPLDRLVDVCDVLHH